MWVVFLLLLLLVPLPLSVQAEDLRSHKTPPDKLLQPMNVPMDDLMRVGQFFGRKQTGRNRQEKENKKGSAGRVRSYWKK